MAKPRKMKAYATYDLWLEDQTPAHQKLIGVLRKLVKKAAPELTEAVKWGNGCHVGPEWPAIYLYADVDHLQFGFLAGVKLDDPKNLLQGNGSFVRHIKVRSPKDIDASYFSRLVRQAAKINARALSTGAAVKKKKKKKKKKRK